MWTNIRNGSVPSTGKFTAPTSGTYYFSCTIMKSTGPVLVFLMHNNQRIESIYPGLNSIYEGNTLNIAVILSIKGDQVYNGIQIHIHAGYINSGLDSHMSFFSGFMITNQFYKLFNLLISPDLAKS